MNRVLGLLIWLLVPGVLARSGVTPPQAAAGTGTVLSLEEAVRLALGHAPDIALARATAARAGEALRETRALNLPQVVAGTGLAYNNGFPLSIEGAAPSIVQVGLSQSILSGRNRNLIREAEEGLRAGQAGPDTVRNQLAGRAALLYNELHQARLAVPLLEEELEAARRRVATAETLLQAGRLLPLDLGVEKVAVANREQQLLVMRERARLAEAGLREVTGLPAGQELVTATPEIRSELLALPDEELYRRALGAHPEIREAEAALRAREFHVEAEKAERYPQINIVGEYALLSRTNNYQDYFNRFTRNNYLLGLSIQVPVFNGSRTAARIGQSRQEVDIARLRLERLKSELRMALEHNRSDLRVAIGAVELARLEVENAEARVRVDEALLEAGRIGLRDLDVARSEWFEKRAAGIEARRVLFESQVALLQAGGTLAEVF